MDRHVRPGGARVPLLLVCMLAAIVAWMLVAAGAAAAAPTEPTWTLDQLQTAINAAPATGLPGYFKTVLKGATITDVPVEILAVADGQNPQDGSALILFQIADSTIVAEGGLAEGMSGSPLFVGDASDPKPDTDHLVGAASYGDEFTTTGLGLATPIEYMESIETDYDVAPLGAALATAGSPAAPSLQATGPVLPKTRTAVAARPVKTAAGTLDRFLLARSRTVARTLHTAAGTAVFVPLSAVEIGGIPSASKAFKRLSAEFEKRGVDVIAGGAGLGAGGSTGFETDLVGGASVAAVLASGDVWGGFFGTVTYAHDNVVVAFGHPADYDGPSGLDMANADVYGIWADSMSSYKIFSLGMTRGLITQDRTYGVAGELFPDAPADTPEVPVSASAQLGENAPVSSLTDVPLWAAENPDWGSMIIASACYFPVSKATDALAYPGSATMDSTVTVIDPTPTPNATYAPEIDNVFDDTYDVGQYAGEDAGDMVDELLSNPNGTAPAIPSSVSFVAKLSPVHNALQVLDFRIPGGLRHGANTVRAFVRDYGEKGTHEEDVTLNVPTTVATTGTVYVYDSNGFSPPSPGYGPGDGSSSGPAGRLSDVPTPAIPDSTSLPDLVDEVNGWLPNDTLNATLVADVANSYTEPVSTVTATRLMTDGGTTWFVQGNISKDTTEMRLRPQVPVVTAKHYVKLFGYVEAEDANATTVAFYRGSSATAFATVPVHVNSDGTGLFSVKVKLGTSATTFKAVWGGSGEYIGATASCKVRVRR